MGKGQSIVVTLRKVSTGAKVTSFSMDDLNHAYSIATVLVRSSEYGRCYCVGMDWQQEPLFNVQPSAVQQAPAPYQAPSPHHAPQATQQAYYAPPQQHPGYALPAHQGYAPHPQQMSPRPYIDVHGESEPFAPPPGYPMLGR
jgi:hypothetical protein